MNLTVDTIVNNPYLINNRADLPFDLYMVSIKTDPNTYSLIDIGIRRKYPELADIAVDLLPEVAVYVPLTLLTWNHVLKLSSSVNGCKRIESHLDDFPSFKEVFYKLVDANAPELRSNISIFERTDAELLFNLFQSYKLKIDDVEFEDLNF